MSGKSQGNPSGCIISRAPNVENKEQFVIRGFIFMNKMKRKGILKRLAVCSVSLTMLLSATACGKPDNVGGKIAVICKNEKVSFWDEVKKGADDCCDEMGYDMLYYCASSDNDFASQIEYINDAINQGAKAIVIAPNDPNELTEAFDRATAKGIKIVNINSRSNYDDIVSYVGSSDFDGGAVAARNAVKILRVTDPNLANVGKVAIIGHTADTAEARIEGFTSVLTSQIVKNMEFDGTLTPEEEMAGVRSDEKIAEQKKEATEKFQKGILQGNPCAKRDAARDEALKLLKDDGNGISVMFGTNTNTTLGICDAVSQLGLGSNIVVVGFNSDEDELNYIRTGVLDGTVVQNPYIMGYVGVRYVHKVIQHSTVPVELNTGSTFVTQANMNDDYVQLLLYPDKQ
jgi:ribose transport system substrate-binding protein